MNMRMLSVSLLLCAVMALTVDAGRHVVNKRFVRCPNGWNELFGNCYKFVGTARAWADAEKNCLSQGGNLASIHSKAEHTFIQDLIRSKTRAMTQSWIGGFDATDGNAAWMWTDGRPMTFTAWASNEPNTGRQNCLVMNFSGQRLWDDEWCTRRFDSVCKKPAGNPE